jgi:hypothetical protein
LKHNSWVGVKVIELMKFKAIWMEVEWSWSSARINYTIQLILQWHCLTLHLTIFKSDLKLIRNWSNLIVVINLIWLILNDIYFYLIESDLSGCIVLFYWILKRYGVLCIGVAKEIVHEINLNTILLK